MSEPRTEAGKRLLEDWMNDEVLNRLPPRGLVSEQIAAIEAEAAAQERGRWVAVMVALGYGVDMTNSEANALLEPDMLLAIAQAWRREPHGWPDVRSAIEDLCEELGHDATAVLALLEGDDAS